MQHRFAMCATTLLATLCTAQLPAQMSGTFVIDPNVPTGTFHTFSEAVSALFVNGVSGPVEIVVAPGSYTESVLVPPITGSSATNTITFRALAGPGTVMIQGGAGDTFAMLAVAFAHNRSIHFDGLDFTGAPGHAISGTRFVEDIEVRNCRFAAGHQSTAAGEFRHAVIVSENSGNDEGWRVHHNHITLSPHTNRTSYGIYLQNGGDWDITHNTFDLNGADYGLWLINNNRTIDRIHNNLFIGSLRASTSSSHNNAAVIRADISNYDNDIAHNTFAVTIPINGCCIATGGYSSGSITAQNYIHGNVFFVLGTGTAVIQNATSSGSQPFVADGNIYFCPAGSVGRIGPSSTGTAYATLAAWQAATGQDTNSQQTDPLLSNPFGTPVDLHPTPTSPVAGAAMNTPSYITDDYDGRVRDAMPDVGAYESTSFALYGAGCPGTGSLVPAMGSTGTVALGSTNFTLELAQAAPSTLAVLFGGFSRTLSVAGPLPYAIGGTCEVLASPDALASFVTSPQGAASVPYNIPGSPSLSGVDVFFQWAIVDGQSASSFGLAVSEGGALQL